MNNTFTTILALLTALPAFSQRPAQPAHKYIIGFTKVADDTQGFKSFGQFPTINNDGQVAFSAASRDLQEGVFRSRAAGAEMTPIATTANNLSFFTTDIAINASGVVAFNATTASGSRAVFKGDGISRTMIADSAANRLLKIGVGSPSINASGVVAFFSVRAEPGFPSSIFTGTGGPLTTVLASSATGFTGFGNVAINESGTIAFRGLLNDGGEGLFAFRGGPIGIVDTTQHPEFFGFGDPVINNAGTVADVAALAVQGIEMVSGDGRGFVARTDHDGNSRFANAEHPSINNHGAIAFFAFSGDPATDMPAGIYLEVSRGHSVLPVIRPGDTLFGSTVVDVRLGRFALNEGFQMAFSYTLADGHTGVAIASYGGESEAEGTLR
jgi:hypothetical protein